MRSLFFLLIVSFPFSLTAQILRVSADEIKHHLYSSDAYFNKKFADINKLKTVTGKFSIKKELQPIKETGRSYIYDFDERGQMVKQLETFYKKGHVLDTSITYFYYDEKGNISLKRTNDPQGFFSYTYEYDSNDRMLYYSYNRDENANKNK
ncbi:hypothetical protein JYU20_04630, partial [Bacteroidales bacterium AH-315-I05]|nr:hypothetical protein [Bacteroidales bacterium AH-315-I05]